MANKIEDYLNGVVEKTSDSGETGALGRYLAGEAQDASWVEEQHPRSPNGRFSSGGHSGKQKSENEDEGRKHGSKGDGDKSVRKGEVEQDVAEKAVREAFEKSGGGLESMKLVGHHLSVKTSWKEDEEVDGRVGKINDVLKEHGLKAKVESGTTLHVAEDAGEEDEYDITNDPVTSVLVGICAVGMLAKDLHYRAKGKPFYGMHELSDVAWKIERHFDELNEVYFMGEKGVNPPERASVASVAARIAGTPGDEDALIAALVDLLGKVAEFVESVKNSGVSGGTSAILDEVSKDALQAKGLLKRTQLDSLISNPASKQVDTSAIDKVIGKGLVIGGSASTAQDSVTHEGAIKAAQTRKAHRGGVDWSKVNLADGAKDWVDKGGIYLLHNKNGHFVSGHGQYGLGISTHEDYKNKAKRFSSEADADKFVRSHYGIAVGAPLSSSYTVMKGLPNLDNHPIWSKPENHRTLNDDGDSGYGPLPGSMT